LSNGIEGKELVDFWFWNKMQIQVCSLIPKRKKGMKLQQIHKCEFKGKSIYTNYEKGKKIINAN
jgi:hypothetical protein